MLSLTFGCIDGTHIRIQAPSEDEKSYVNRKKYHSINVMAVCDHRDKLPHPLYSNSIFVNNLHCRLQHVLFP